MKWQFVRSEKYCSRDDSWEGECPRFIERAILFIHLRGVQESKFDLQPTFTPQIKECSLLKEKGYKDKGCTLSCPIFEEYKNSHSY